MAAILDHKKKMRTCKIERSIRLAIDGECGLKGLSAEEARGEKLKGYLPRVQKWVKDPLGSRCKVRNKVELRRFRVRIRADFAHCLSSLLISAGLIGGELPDDSLIQALGRCRSISVVNGRSTSSKAYSLHLV